MDAFGCEEAVKVKVKGRDFEGDEDVQKSCGKAVSTRKNWRKKKSARNDENVLREASKLDRTMKQVSANTSK